MTEPKRIGSFDQVGAALMRRTSENSFVDDFFERYRSNYVEEPMSGCWLWIASQTTGGYGNLRSAGGRTLYAHRCSYEAVHGAGSSSGGVVRHRCDNPCCINPDHLVIGTYADNNADAWRRGRMRPVKGEFHPRAVLTENDVIAIRSRAANGEPVCEIVSDYSVGRNAIESALTGLTWSHLPGSIELADVAKKPTRPPHRRGSEVCGAVLTEDAVATIKQRLREGETGRSLAAEFGVSTATISAINVGRLWSHVA